MNYANGIVGKLTLMKINDYPNQKELFDKLWNRRLKHFQNIAENSVIALENKLGRKLTDKEIKEKSQKRFLSGWINRLKMFHYE